MDMAYILLGYEERLLGTVPSSVCLFKINR